MTELFPRSLRNRTIAWTEKARKDIDALAPGLTKAICVLLHERKLEPEIAFDVLQHLQEVVIQTRARQYTAALLDTVNDMSQEQIIIQLASELHCLLSHRTEDDRFHTLAEPIVQLWRDHRAKENTHD